ncbi:MAG: putative manganese transporter [Patescibacteria group bacterium]
MIQIFIDALLDSLKMIPFLLVVYILIELIEYKYGNQIRQKIQKAGHAGPAIGALVGSFPQCGFSVISTALYTQRLLTIGSLVAVYLSTSDEAIPVILSQPDKAGIIIPLILTKIIIALIAGYLLDLIFRKKNRQTLQHAAAYASGVDIPEHHHDRLVEETACCGHCLSSKAKKFSTKEIIIHPLIHTFKIFGFVFAASFLINLLIFYIGENNLQLIFSQHQILQPFLAALFGLIPNCASSVAITELYLKGVITYGAVIAGLSASGGLGLLVLLKEDKNRRDVFTVIGLLFGISVLAGLIIQYLF